MKIREVLFGILLGILLGIYDVIFSSFVPAPISFLHLSIPLTAFCIAIERRRLALGIALSAGLIFDLFAIGASGLALARMAVAAGAAWLLQAQVLTNRSLYATVLLALVVRSVDTLWLWGISALFRALNQPMIFAPTWDMVWKRAGMDIAVVVLLFLAQLMISRRFRRRS